ncbi:hypothetical protein [Longimicrobium sp.]|uniref:hypothetical protein n=1 Tax=Longimicrobium sp. TaxID=2029185 RepID=UPI002ED889ED
MKNGDAAIAVEWAAKGWVAYINEMTAGLPATHPVDLRIRAAAEYAGFGKLPTWLEDAVRVRLSAQRGEALVRQLGARRAG